MQSEYGTYVLHWSLLINTTATVIKLESATRNGKSFFNLSVDSQDFNSNKKNNNDDAAADDDAAAAAADDDDDDDAQDDDNEEEEEDGRWASIKVPHFTWNNAACLSISFVSWFASACVWSNSVCASRCIHKTTVSPVGTLVNVCIMTINFVNCKLQT